jgi:hypothetical protein
MKPKYLYLPHCRRYGLTLERMWQTRLDMKNARRKANGLPPLTCYSQV